MTQIAVLLGYFKLLTVIEMKLNYNSYRICTGKLYYVIMKPYFVIIIFGSNNKLAVIFEQNA